MELNLYKYNLKVIVFDLDGTLAVSKTPMSSEMSTSVIELLEKYTVCVISGGSFLQFEKQILSQLKGIEDSLLQKLFLFPTNGSTFYKYINGTWQCVYEEKLTEDEKKMIIDAWTKSIQKAGIVLQNNLYGEVMEDRGTQITFSLCGQNAPVEIKSTCDPDMAKRSLIREAMLPLLSGFSVTIAGMTSIDITRAGIDKAYAINKILQYLKLEKENVLFIGDKLDKGGNDFSAKTTGVNTLSVNNPNDTLVFIKDLLRIS